MKNFNWGWNPFYNNEMEKYIDSGLSAGRVIRETRHLYLIAYHDKTFTAEVSGAFRYKAAHPSDFPVIGDWVLFRQEKGGLSMIEEVMLRKSCFSRKAAGEKTDEQVIAANIDIIYLVFGIHGGRNFTAGGLERYLTLAWDSGANPMILLNKADLASDEEREKALLTAENCAPGVDIHLISAITGEGLDNLIKPLKPGTTIALTGPSGVGKSTLINSLAGEALQKTNVQREGDLKGMHTTTSRELFLLSSGVMLIDSPGLKEIQLWAEDESVGETFSDIRKLAENCRFTDCSHQGEPGCAVQEALVEGELEYRRYDNYLDLMKEVSYLKTKQSETAARDEREKGKNFAKLIKDVKKGNKRLI